MQLEWTQEQRRAIEDHYWNEGYVRCPIDDTRLDIEETTTLGQPASILAQCKRCGRHFSGRSDDEMASASAFESKYEEIRPIGQGGMGAVVLVRDRTTGDMRAAKTIKPSFVRDEENVLRFQRERRVLEQLDHPNIVKLRETFLDEKGGVLVMDYMPNGDLQRQIRDKSITDATLLALFEDLVRGVAHLHAQGIVHRDLKPENILVDEHKRGRVSDFGLAMFLERDSTKLSKTGIAMGTPRYIAPEQIADFSHVTPKADVYAVALMACEIFLRESPYDVLSFDDGEFAAVIKRGKHRDPKERTATLDDLVTGLRAALERAGRL